MSFVQPDIKTYRISFWFKLVKQFHVLQGYIDKPRKKQFESLTPENSMDEGEHEYLHYSIPILGAERVLGAIEDRHASIWSDPVRFLSAYFPSISVVFLLRPFSFLLPLWRRSRYWIPPLQLPYCSCNFVGIQDLFSTRRCDKTKCCLIWVILCLKAYAPSFEWGCVFKMSHSPVSFCRTSLKFMRALLC